MCQQIFNQYNSNICWIVVTAGECAWGKRQKSNEYGEKSKLEVVKCATQQKIGFLAVSDCEWLNSNEIHTMLTWNAADIKNSCSDGVESQSESI